MALTILTKMKLIAQLNMKSLKFLYSEVGITINCKKDKGIINYLCKECYT